MCFLIFYSFPKLPRDFPAQNTNRIKEGLSSPSVPAPKQRTLTSEYPIIRYAGLKFFSYFCPGT